VKLNLLVASLSKKARFTVSRAFKTDLATSSGTFRGDRGLSATGLGGFPLSTVLAVGPVQLLNVPEIALPPSVFLEQLLADPSDFVEKGIGHDYFSLLID
jgi:hypothetical protein